MRYQFPPSSSPARHYFRERHQHRGSRGDLVSRATLPIVLSRPFPARFTTVLAAGDVRPRGRAVPPSAAPCREAGRRPSPASPRACGAALGGSTRSRRSASSCWRRVRDGHSGYVSPRSVPALWKRMKTRGLPGSAIASLRWPVTSPATWLVYSATTSPKLLR